MPTWTFIKRGGAPAGTITVGVSDGSFVIDDSANPSIITSSPAVAAELIGVPYLQLQGGAPTPAPTLHSVETVFLDNGVLSKAGPGGTTVPLDGASGRFLTYAQAIVGSAPPIQAVADPSGSYGYATIFGNKAGFGFSGTGSPAGVYAPVGFYQSYGDDTNGTNAAVLKSTQGMFGQTQYWGPTSDDSAQGGNFGVYMKNSGSTPYTQTKQVTGLEFDVQVEGNVNVVGANAYALGYGTRMTILSGGTVTNGYGSKVSAWTSNNKGASYGALTNWRGYFDDLYNPAGTIAANSESFHGVNRITSEQSVNIARSGYGASVLFDLQGNVGGLGANLAVGIIQQPSPNNTTTIADGGFTLNSRLMTTATAPTVAWLGRLVTNANVPVGTHVLNYYGTGPYTVVLDQTATATASGQSVTIVEPDLVGLKIVQGAGGLQRPIEYWQQGVSGAPTFYLSRSGVVAAQGSYQIVNSSGTALTTYGSGITFADANNIAVGTTTGTKIGTAGGAAGQKLGFFNATPVVQPLLATGAGHTADDVITVLQTLGLARQS